MYNNLQDQLSDKGRCYHKIGTETIDLSDVIRGQIVTLKDVLGMPELLQDKQVLELARTASNMPSSNITSIGGGN